MPRFTNLALVLLALFFQGTAEGRIWTSKNGHYKLEADAVAFNQEMVVLKKPTGALVAVELAQLSEADVQYVQSKELADATAKAADEMQTWTSNDGLKVRGRVTAYGRKEVNVQRRLGKVYVNDQLFSTIDPLHQKVILRIISHLEKTTLADEKDLEKWAKTIGGEPKVYPLEGVLLELESGDVIGVPFFLFAPKELAILQPGWDLWVQQNQVPAAQQASQEQQNFLMRSAAMAYQANRDAQHQQMEMLKLDMLATMTGVISIWEVGLRPGPGVYGYPLSVMVPAQNSAIATNTALQRYPGYVIIGVRRASN